MNCIIYLKKLGFSLEEIRELFDEGLTSPSFEAIRTKVETCRKEQTVHQWRIDELDLPEKQLTKQPHMETVSVKSLPAIIVASHRRIIADYDALFELRPNIIGPEMARLGCTCP